MMFLTTYSSYILLLASIFVLLAVPFANADSLSICESDMADYDILDLVNEFKKDVSESTLTDEELEDKCHGFGITTFDFFTASFDYTCDSGAYGGHRDRPSCYPHSCTAENDAEYVREDLKTTEVGFETCDLYNITFDELGPPPSASPTSTPSSTPTTSAPSASPTSKPSASPTIKASTSPTSKPSASPTAKPSATPTSTPSTVPSMAPTPTPRMGMLQSILFCLFLLFLWYFIVIKNA
mmetsp:Transcript_24607/g.27179  ORF Transcript_24607/g.27179 Transcript_24607/m.27179 type:complete len:239 (-) Transcript_24607:135-851(-)